jgi:hypothetical protein
MSNTVNNTPGTSNPDPVSLNADAVIAQLRTMRSQIEDVAPLSREQRKLIQQRLRLQPKTVVDASINVIGVLDNVSQAIGQPLDEVRQLQDDSLRWDAAADEARAFLKGIEGANLNRRCLAPQEGDASPSNAGAAGSRPRHVDGTDRVK